MGLVLTEEAVRKIVREELADMKKELSEAIELLSIRCTMERHIDTIKLMAITKILGGEILQKDEYQSIINGIVEYMLNDENDPLMVKLQDAIVDIGSNELFENIQQKITAITNESVDDLTPSDQETKIIQFGDISGDKHE